MKVLMSAYACAPRRGSEHGVGWNWIAAAARDHEVVVLTRRGLAPVIEPARIDLPPSVTFEYVDVPRWLSLSGRVARAERLYYCLWQIVAGRRARKLHARHRFDVVHHITYANGWLPALTFVPGARFVLGPVGGSLDVPRSLLRSLGWRSAAKELARSVLRRAAHLSPIVRASWRRADVIVAQHARTVTSMPERYRKKAIVRPNAIAPDELIQLVQGLPRPSRAGHTAIFAGRLLPLKGVHLALRAIARTPQWHLVVAGAGPDSKRLERLVLELGIMDRVEFRGRLSQRELWKAMSGADVLILPSLRDESPLVTIEAHAVGLPVIALDQGGPAELAKALGSRFTLIRTGTSEDVVANLAAALTNVEPGETAFPLHEFTVEGVRAALTGIYRASEVAS